MLATASLPSRRVVTADRPAVRAILIGAALAFLGLFLLLPLLAVFVEALRQGLGAYLAGITEPDALAAELSAAGVADDVAAALQRDYALVRAQRAAIEQAIADAPADVHLRELWAHAYETELELNDLYGRTIMTYRRGSDI